MYKVFLKLSIKHDIRLIRNNLVEVKNLLKTRHREKILLKIKYDVYAQYS